MLPRVRCADPCLSALARSNCFGAALPLDRLDSHSSLLPGSSQGLASALKRAQETGGFFCDLHFDRELADHPFEFGYVLLLLVVLARTLKDHRSILDKLLFPAAQGLLAQLILPTRFSKRFDPTDHCSHHLRLKLSGKRTPFDLGHGSAPLFLDHHTYSLG